MKKHEWKIYKLELQPDPGRFDCQILRGLLINTDRRRKVKYFGLPLQMGELTLEIFAEMLKDGQRIFNVLDGSRPKRKKNNGPKVDPRQVEMFGGDNVKEDLE